MTRWLQAARSGEWRTDKLTEPSYKQRRDAMLHVERGFRQYRQSVSKAPDTEQADQQVEVPSVSSVRQYGSPRDKDMSSNIAAAVILAFEDYAATDDPRDPRAWT